MVSVFGTCNEKTYSRGFKQFGFNPEAEITYEPRHEKNQHFTHSKTKTQISFAVTTKLISAFVFAT